MKLFTVEDALAMAKKYDADNIKVPEGVPSAWMMSDIAIAAMCNEVAHIATTPLKEENARVLAANKDSMLYFNTLMEDFKTTTAALHEISLCSQNSTSSKEECGKMAREALGKL